MLPVEKRLLIKVAQMYYLENMNQNEIADKFGINRTTVSKYLKRAMQSGLVQISVANDRYENLENALEKRFNLKEVYILPTGADLGMAGFRYLKRIIKDGDVVGFARGVTIAALSNSAVADACTAVNAEMVPLVGGPENDVDSEYHVNTIVYKVATAFKAKSHYLYAPAIVATAEAKEVMVQDPNCRRVISMWDKVDIAIVGIGAPIRSSNSVWGGSFGKEYAHVLREKGVAGDVCSRFYDLNGKVIETELNDKTIAIELEALRKTPYSIGVASAPEKIPAIYGALQGKFINVLISDEETAKLLLEYKP